MGHKKKEPQNPDTPPKGDNNKKIGIILFVVVLIVIGLSLVILLQQPGSNNETPKGNPIAVITTTMGTIRVELFADKVPTTVENFVKLANDGFYNGLVFHRVIDNFMIQGGGFYPDGTPKESPYGPINLEINPEVRHVDGAISMARTNDPNSATSQFFICDGPQSFLDDNYAAFGVVIEGLDVVREIASVETTTKYTYMQDWPVTDVIINSITITYAI
ncbi:MAG: peptidylprolyl isomerase [Candidatus Thermoplasmatota archaeon]